MKMFPGHGRETPMHDDEGMMDPTQCQMTSSPNLISHIREGIFLPY